MTQRNFLATLFDPEDQTCFTNTPYGVDSYPATADISTEYFTINALHGTRSDAHVTKHRTFLIEFDNMPLNEQLPYMLDSNIPYTACVFSGNKSYHFFITLDEPVSAAEYACLFKRLELALPQLDRSCKNPSRLARLADAKRGDVVQTLQWLGERIPLSFLLTILPELPLPDYSAEDMPARVPSDRVRGAVNMPNEMMTKLGLRRNGFFHWLGQRMQEAQLAPQQKKIFVEHAYSLLNDTKDFTINEAYMAARIKGAK